MSYYVTVVFDMPCESEYRFLIYLNPDSLIEYSLNRHHCWRKVSQKNATLC